MTGRQQKALLVLCCVGLPVAGLAAPFFIVDDGFRDRPIDVSFPDLDPHQRVRACQTRLSETTTSVEAAQRDLNRAKSELAAAERDYDELPVRIAEFESRLLQLDTEMDQHRDSLATAEATYTELAAAAPRRIAQFGTEAEERRQSELEAAFNEIDEARQHRDELRRQRGHAHTIGGMDEAILARQKKRQATEQADAGLAWEVGQFEAELNGEVAAARKRVQTYERLITNAQFAYSESDSELDESWERLASLPETIEQAHSRIAAAESRLSQLTESQQLHESALALAQADLDEYQRVLMAEGARERRAQATSFSSSRSSGSSRTQTSSSRPASSSQRPASRTPALYRDARPLSQREIEEQMYGDQPTYWGPF